MGQCPDCGERIGKSLQHDCPHPGEKRHMVELLRAKIAELADERTAITQMLDRIEPKLDKAGGQSKELTERLAFWIDRAEKAEKERDDARAEVERLKGEKPCAVPVGLDSTTGDAILEVVEQMEKAEWQYLLQTARELAKMYDGRDGVIRDFLSAVGALGEDEEVEVEVEELDEDEECRKAEEHAVIGAAIEVIRCDKEYDRLMASKVVGSVPGDVERNMKMKRAAQARLREAVERLGE